jgi:hypothetical protein
MHILTTNINYIILEIIDKVIVAVLVSLNLKIYSLVNLILCINLSIIIQKIVRAS